MTKSIYSFMTDEALFALVSEVSSAQVKQMRDGPLSDHEMSYMYELLGKLDAELVRRQQELFGA